jgi:choloylglycine hydrolase
MGAIGLPGDLSSTSRFIRASFHTENSKGDGVTDLFHLLASVAMPDGSVRVGDAYERTEYSTVADLEAADYYYRPYDGAGIVTVSLSRANTDGSTLERYPIVRTAPMAQN